MSMNTIPEALDELRAGHVIIVVDDPDRENEGDMICAAEFATQANVNLMASVAKGLICMPMSRNLAHKLSLEQMVSENTDNHETAFTVSIDHVSTTTGISAAERSTTALKCVDDDAKPGDFRRPGHMFPLVAKPGGVLERNGHTEATVDLMPSCRHEAVRPVLRDHARGRHHDAHERAARACARAQPGHRLHQTAAGLVPHA